MNLRSALKAHFPKKALVFLAALALAWAGVPAGAAADKLLTRDMARSLALARSQSLQRARLAVDGARLAEKAGRYDMLPSLSASAGGELASPRSSLAAAAGGSVGIGVKQTIYDGSSSVQRAIDSLDTGIAQEEARAEYYSVLAAADTAFAGVVDALASLDAARSDLEAARRRQALAEAKLEAGIIIRADLLKAQSETAAAETSVAQARGRLSTAYAKLASLTGLALPFSVDTSDPPGTTQLTQRLASLGDEQTAALVARLQEVVASVNPALGRAALAEKKAGRSRDLAWARGLPTVAASFSSQLGLSAAGVSPGGALAISVSVPLDFWKVKNAVSAGEIALQQAGLDTKEAQRTTALEVESAVYDLVAAARAVQSSTKALEYAESNYEAVLEKYRLSTLSSTDLGAAASLASTARAQLITARSQLLASLSSLRTMTAEESDSLITGLVP